MGAILGDFSSEDDFLKLLLLLPLSITIHHSLYNLYSLSALNF